MNELQIFDYEGKQVRTVEKDGATWWVLRDVCEVLELTTPSRVAERLDEDEVSQTHITDSLGRQQETIVINESGLYSVILRSDKPESKPFRKWVTSEVLPTIRRTGSYRIQEPVTASSAGGIASAVKRADDIMKAQKASGHDRAVVADSIFHQFGLFLPDVFIQSKPLEQVLMERWLDKMTQVKRLD